MNIAILLDGDFSRRMIERKLGHNPNPSEIESFCKSVISPGEDLFKTVYYDCPPFSETRILPVSGKPYDFSRTKVYLKAMPFQKLVKSNPFFEYRGGHLSFDGWTLKDSSIKALMAAPRPLLDSDFEPVLTQKQVDMKIGFDVAKLSLNQTVGRILLATSDADFVPAIHFARSYKIEVELLSDVFAVRKTKGILMKAFTRHRIV